jgi:hypothetical protein
MKGKMELLMNLKNVDPNIGNVIRSNSKSMKFFFLENC